MIEVILFGTHLLAAILGAVIMRSVIIYTDDTLHSTPKETDVSHNADRPTVGPTGRTGATGGRGQTGATGGPGRTGATGGPGKTGPAGTNLGGSSPKEKRRDRLRVGLILIVASVFMVSIGVSAALFQVQSNSADKAFAARQECLNDFGTKFSDAANARSDVATEVADAQSARDAAELKRDNALDHVIIVVIQARKTPPEATAADFDKALKDFAAAKDELIQAQKTFDKLTKKFESVKNAKPYPKATC